EECHNEWEITFEEIHRNGAIAYAIYRYVNYTNDKLYLVQYGLEVLIAISRFWAQRVNWSDHRSKYVMLGVTGPNEYENNVNNNWYTNYIARWCLQYTLESIDWCLKNNERSWKRLETLLNFKTEEASKWLEIIEKMHLPEDERKGVFLQQDGFMDKLLEPVSSIPLNENPICQNWSWDRILRSCFIKQADVLQGLYFFREDFDQETIERNFEFYEPMTVHESSLSPCVHSILACHLGKKEKAYEMYIRTSRLDLDDYNNDTEDGLHITSMGGTWMSVVEGFGGMRVSREGLSFDPLLPDEWQELQFNILYQGQILTINIEPNKTSIRNLGDEQVQLWVEGRRVTCEPQVLLELDQKE
ncbi:MAG: glycosyl hydrolase family 65 protein, partial [Bacteroidota bacterium]